MTPTAFDYKYYTAAFFSILLTELANGFLVFLILSSNLLLMFINEQSFGAEAK